MLAKSWKSVASLYSIHSSNLDLSQISSDEEIPSFEFEELLPFVCRRFNCDFDLFINKGNTRDDHALHKNIKISTAKAKETPSVTPTSSETPKTSKGKPSNAQLLIVIGVLNSNNKLVEIILYEQPRVPRLLLQVITVIAPVYELFHKITIRNCNIDAYTSYELSKLLALMHITDVCLDDCFLKEANYSVLLEKESALRNLSLCRCYIDDAVCKDIVSKLHYLAPTEKTLIILNMSGNHITDEGATYIGEMLRTNRHLRYLNLAGNRLGDAGACHILDALIEFPLTYDEIAEKRRRLLSYLKRKQDLTKRFINDFELAASPNQGLVGLHSSNKSTMRSSCSLRDRSQQRMLASSLTLGMPENKKQANEVAEQLALEVIGRIEDPLNFKNIIYKEGWSHCIGNLTLSYLNLSYNNLTYFSVKKVLAVLQYQSSHSTGLYKIILEGNCIPESCEEYGQIGELINKRMSVRQEESNNRTKKHSRRGSAQRKSDR